MGGKITEAENNLILNITGSATITEVKESAERFLEYAAGHKVRAKALCIEMIESVSEFSALCMRQCMPADAKAIIVPPEYSPVCMIMTCVPNMKSADIIIAGLKRFIERCGEFEEPKTEVVSVEQIKTVLVIAQERYGYLDFVSPVKPFKVLCFNNSHRYRNNECGIGCDGDGNIESVLMIYSPREIKAGLVDNILIFAHELGHALHLAMTRDVNILPTEYDELNKALKAEMPEELRQEGFADAFALALLGDERLKKHLPSGFSLSPYFDRFFKALIQKYAEKRNSQ